jgi:transcriptional regulator with XRE-family HTH domain
MYFRIPSVSMSKAVKPRYLDGAALRKARIAANLEQEQLAKLAGVKQGQVSGWERGHTGCRLGTLHKLAGVLGIDPVALMRDDDEADDDEAEGAAA